jgi:hypothetical protein
MRPARHRSSGGFVVDHAAGTGRQMAEVVSGLIPGLRDDLRRLVAIASVSSPGYPEPRQPILDACELICELLRDAGVRDVGTLDRPEPARVFPGVIPARAGAPTVLLYSH